MPGTWSDDDGVGEEDNEETPLGGPVHPDDRLWRHPSELAWGVAPSGAEGPSRAVAPPVEGHQRAAAPRLWALALTSAFTGAALTLGLVALIADFGPGGTDRIVERVGVRDQLADPMVGNATEGVAAVTRQVTPSIVRLAVETDEGSTAGSGVVVLDDGHIVTNAHVVDGATSILIVRADGVGVRGDVVGADPVTDVAVVAPLGADDDLEWVPAIRGPAGELSIGEPAVTIGSPFGRSGTPSVTLGVVSALGRWVPTASGGVLHGMIQTDVPVAGGSSGGALCDRSGRVVGIATSHSSDQQGSVGYATPMEAAWAIAQDLIADGVVRHVWLGIEGADIDATPSSILGLTGIGGGVVIERVLPDSPAEAAGLRAGDLLVGVDGDRLSSMSELVLALRRYRPGDDATIELERDGERAETTVTLAERTR